MPGAIPWLDDDAPAPEPLRRPTVHLTEKGRATVSALRLAEQLAVLDADDRGDILAELHERLADLLVGRVD